MPLHTPNLMISVLLYFPWTRYLEQILDLPGIPVTNVLLLDCRLQNALFIKHHLLVVTNCSYGLIHVLFYWMDESAFKHTIILSETFTMWWKWLESGQFIVSLQLDWQFHSSLREKILAWTRIRIRVSSFTCWCSNWLSYPDETPCQARILLLLDPYYPPDEH